MRITFPPSPWSGTYQDFFYQAALASVPLVVDLVATRLLKPYCDGPFWSLTSVENISSTLSITSLYTLFDNQRAFYSGSVVLVARLAYKVYSANYTSDPTSSEATLPENFELPAPSEKLTYREPQFITPGVRTLSDLIERQWINEEEIYQIGGDGSIKTDLQSFDALTELSKLKGIANRARKAGAVFKSYFKQLEVPLLEPILEDLRTAPTAVNKLAAFRRAIANLEPHRKELAGITLHHLDQVSQRSARNKMTIQKLAMIFEPIFFKMKAVELHQGETESAVHIAILIDLIENSEKLF